MVSLEWMVGEEAPDQATLKWCLANYKAQLWRTAEQVIKSSCIRNPSEMGL